MSILSQLNRIEKALQPKIEKAMQNEVANEIIKEGKSQVDKTVYSYKPKQYVRTEKLRDESWRTEKIENGIVVRNIRRENRRYIPKIIETGEGYNYTGYGYDYEKPRPFIQNTREELIRSGKHKKAFKEGMRKQGIDIR